MDLDTENRLLSCQMFDQSSEEQFEALEMSQDSGKAVAVFTNILGICPGSFQVPAAWNR